MLVTPASVSLAPPTSSPSPDANGGTDLQVFDSSDCSTLRLFWVLDAEGGVERLLGNGGGLLENHCS